MRADRFHVIGHRGFAAKYPENTMTSFRRALEAGADGFELDVRMTRDGVPVVLHDEDVARTTGARGALADMSLRAVRELDAGGGERVPTLDEVLAWAATTPAVVAIELKEEEPAVAAVDLAEKHGLRDRCVFASFQAEFLAYPKERKFRFGFLCADEPEEGLLTARSLGADLFLPHFSLLDRDLVVRATKERLRVVPWTVNGRDRVRAAKRWGCAGVITDDPLEAAKARDAPG